MRFLTVLQNLYPYFHHYGVEYYGNGTVANTVVCKGERDPACVAGDHAFGVTQGHLSSFGVTLGQVGCGGGTATNAHS